MKIIPDNESIRDEMEQLFTSTVEDENYIIVTNDDDEDEK